MPGGSLDGIAATWDGVTERDWGRLLASAGRAPVEQAWTYGEAVAAGSRYRARHVVLRRGREAVAIGQALELSLGGAARIAKMVRGPLLLTDDLEPEQRRAVFRLIKDRWPMAGLNLFFWTPELPDTAGARDLLAGLGLRRTVTGYTTAWLDLSPDLADLRAGLHQKWRNQLVRAEGERLRIRDSHGGSALAWLAERHDGHRARRRFRGPTGSFATVLAVLAPRSQDVLVLQAERGSEPVAGVLFLRHGDAATYYIAWTGPRGREAHAHNRLLWEGVVRLREAGVRWLDLGGLDASMPGVSRFKLGLGAPPTTLVGTWL